MSSDGSSVRLHYRAQTDCLHLMSDNTIAIRVEGLSKRYFVGHASARRTDSFRELLARQVKDFARKGLDMARGRPIVQGDVVEEFWALKNVSFETRTGDTVGIIGRNGAGKSTLLKLLSRITEPTTGRIGLRGRVASLLEVGTGFHGELTGRENVFLNGAILGMSRKEILSVFDEIVAFAEIENFLDTPVKRYSSGMYVRLAFSVAAHLKQEILIVDEVLAVGDVAFQQKCLRKMDGAARDGRTVLFVSHDMRKVISLCNRGILLKNGSIQCMDDMSRVADAYLSERLGPEGFADLSASAGRSGSGDMLFQSIELLSNGQRCKSLTFGSPFSQRIRVSVNRRHEVAKCAATIVSSDGVPVFCFMTDDVPGQWTAEVGTHELTVTIDQLNLYPGTYSIDLWLGDRNSYRVDFITEAISFTVTQGADSGLERELDRANGIVYQAARWEQRLIERPIADYPGPELEAVRPR